MLVIVSDNLYIEYLFKLNPLLICILIVNDFNCIIQSFNPIPAGVLENQDMLGGVNLTPPLNPMFYVQI